MQLFVPKIMKPKSYRIPGMTQLLCVRGGLIGHNISIILHYLHTYRVRLAVVCGEDRVVGDSSYCKVMQCETSCRRSIVQCENSSDPMTLKIVQCELGVTYYITPSRFIVKINHYKCNLHEAYMSRAEWSRAPWKRTSLLNSSYMSDCSCVGFHTGTGIFTLLPQLNILPSQKHKHCATSQLKIWFTTSPESFQSVKQPKHTVML